MTAPLQAVLVGCGAISRVWLEALRDISFVQVVALVDRFPEKARTCADQFDPSVTIETSLERAISDARPDVVFDCTTPDNRLVIAEAALTGDCHVLAEKPLAATLTDAFRLRKLADASRRSYAVVQNHRHHPELRRLASFLRGDGLGTLTSCSSSFAVGSQFTDFRRTLPHVLLSDMAIHTFDAARWLVRSDPVSVYCREWNPVGSTFEHDAAAVVLFEFANGVVYDYRGKWCAAGLRTPWESHWRFDGTEGSLVWGEDGFRCEVRSPNADGTRELRKEGVPPACHPHGPGHFGVISEFVDAVRSGRRPPTHVADNIESLKMVLAAIESSEKDRPVLLDEFEP